MFESYKAHFYINSTSIACVFIANVDVVKLVYTPGLGSGRKSR